MMYTYCFSIIFVMCLMIKHYMSKKLFDIEEFDFVRLCMITMLVVATFYGSGLKSVFC